MDKSLVYIYIYIYIYKRLLYKNFFEKTNKQRALPIKKMKLILTTLMHDLRILVKKTQIKII